MKLVCAILVIFLVECAMCQVVSNGKCAVVKPKSDFKVKPFMGNWYGAKKIPWAPTEGFKCNYAAFKQTSETSVTITNHGINKTTNEPSSTVTHIGTVLYPGVWHITGDDNASDFEINYIATDYRNYAAAYACKQISAKVKKQWLWLLSREHKLDDKYLKKALTAFRKNGIELNSIESIDQTNCPAVY